MIRAARSLFLLSLIAACLLAACARVAKPVSARHLAPPPAATPVPAGYAQRPEVQAFIAQLVQQDGFDRNWLETTLGAAQKRDDVLAAIAKPYEAKPWYQYRPLFVNSARIRAGVAFWDAHSVLLSKAQEQYGVPPAIIVAILGVESFYGHQKGGYRVLDALTTLAFDYPARADFFQKELEQYLLLCREQRFNPLTLTGSYAGAMGAPQFMPDSYRQYAASFERGGHPDIWNNWGDIIASVAHYFQVHGWQANGLIAVPAYVPSVVELPDSVAHMQPTRVGALRRLGVFFSSGLNADDEALLIGLQEQSDVHYWVGLHNFRVITQYNKSALYAMAVTDLATRIAEARTNPDHDASP